MSALQRAFEHLAPAAEQPQGDVHGVRSLRDLDYLVDRFLARRAAEGAAAGEARHGA